jgi:hypothetical protein
MGNADARRLLLVATIAALSLTAVVAIVALLAGDFGETQLRILATTGGFGLVSLLSMRGSALLEEGRELGLGRAVIALSALAFLTEMWAVWFDTDSTAAWKTFVCAIASAAALGQIAGMIAKRRPTDPPSIASLVWGSGSCAVVLAFMGITAALAEVDDAGYYKFFGVVAVLDVLGVVLQPVVRRLGRTAGAAVSTTPQHGVFVCVLADGRRLERAAEPDLPTAVARVLRDALQRGERVQRIELGGD